jgi:hypothetical protein
MAHHGAEKVHSGKMEAPPGAVQDHTGAGAVTKLMNLLELIDSNPNGYISDYCRTALICYSNFQVTDRIK